MRYKLLGWPMFLLAGMSEPAWAQPAAVQQIEQYRQVGQRFGLRPEQVAEVYRFIDTNAVIIQDAAKQNRVNGIAFRAIARELGLRNYGADQQQLLVAIRNRAKDAAKFEEQARVAREEVAALKNAAIRTPAATALARADASYAVGDLDGAQTALDEVLDLRAAEFVSARNAWEAASRAAVDLAQTRGDIERLEQLITRAANIRRQRAEQQAELDRKAGWQDQMTLADTLYAQGEIIGDSNALQWSIKIYRERALPLADRKLARLDWAMTQHSLGKALSTLGEFQGWPTALEEAVAAYSAALQERTRDKVPLDWAQTQNNLANALAILGDFDKTTARIEQAVAIYRLALEERTRERVPIEWAATQNNLGNALLALGERDSGTVRLEQAVAAYRAALEESTRDRVPRDWSMVQNNLGAALQKLGERESGTERLKEAVTAFRAALQERGRESVPLTWAETQNNLGAALFSLGEREGGTARLEQAVVAYRSALQVRTRDHTPLAWAQSTYFGALAIARLGERSSSVALVREAQAWLGAVRSWAAEVGATSFLDATSHSLAAIELLPDQTPRKRN